MVTKTFNGKRYRYYASEASKHMALKRADTIRRRDGLKARVAKDPRKYASTWHIYVRR